MIEKNKEIKEKFDTLFAEWEEAIQDPRIQSSSNSNDYRDNEPYREIVKLGKDALPFIIEKLEQGKFFLNKAVVDILGLKMKEIIGKENRFPSEQKKSTLLVQWWRSQKQ